MTFFFLLYLATNLKYPLLKHFIEKESVLPLYAYFNLKPFKNIYSKYCGFNAKSKPSFLLITCKVFSIGEGPL